MPQNIGRLVGLVFFGSLVLWMIVTIIAVISPSSATSKAALIFGILAIGSFFGLLGTFLMERIDSLRGVAPAATPSAAGARPTSFQG
jgi:hypothetical protein